MFIDELNANIAVGLEAAYCRINCQCTQNSGKRRLYFSAAFGEAFEMGQALSVSYDIFSLKMWTLEDINIVTIREWHVDAKVVFLEQSLCGWNAN